jgi:1,4-alpha-glucan branching enzyme
MNKGFFCLVLHAHLPYVRHPEHEYFLEENWFYEAINETYIPLLEILDRLINDDIDFRITISISPTLLEMLNDGLLMERFKRHIERLEELSEKELCRIKGDIHFEPVVIMYHDRFKRIKYLFEDIYKKDLVSVFKALRDSGKVEFIPTAATHAFLPNLSLYPRAVKAQIQLGAVHFRKNFGRYPQGIWLPECGYAPDFDSYIKQEGLKFFFLDTHGILNATPQPKFSVYAPIRCPSDVFAFGRDFETSKQVWSSFGGYPGDFDYRDFYRDIGFDISTDYVESFLEPYGARTYTGLKYYSITGKTDKKEPYIIGRARQKVAEHADHFIFSRDRQVNSLRETLKIQPVITAMYDAELFGHWWFEGIDWLDLVLRKIHRTERNFRMINPSEYLESNFCQTHELQLCNPPLSSWGDKGYSQVWLNTSNDYVYRHILVAIERMQQLADRFQNTENLVQRALNQAARELLLSQHSDWIFMMKTDNVRDYACRRFEEHMIRFNYLYHSIISGNISEQWLTEIEERDRIFKDIDYRMFRDNR